MYKSVLLVLLSVLPAAALGAGPQRIGVAGGVSGLVKATAPAAAEARVITSGAPLFLNDRVVTDAKGKLQVLLLDETVFTVGPNSNLQLDEFVYDPSNDAGKVTVKVTKGVFRFVTGKVARKEPANMNVKLPVGTIGIRGTMFFVGVEGGPTDAAVLDGTLLASNYIPGEEGQGAAAPALQETVILLGPGAGNNANEAPGAILVDNGVSSLQIDQPGFGVTLGAGLGTLRATDMSQQAALLTSDLAAPPAPGQGQGTSGGGAPLRGHAVSEQAGQTTAAGGARLASAVDIDDITRALNETSDQAALDITSNAPHVTTIPDGISTWDNVRSVQTGLLNYSASGYCAITGSAAGTYDLTFNMLVDFGNRRYGGGPSSIQLGTPLPDSTNILPSDFASLTGNAAITLAVNNGNIENSAFDGTLITFNNAGGVPAANAAVNVIYNSVQGRGSKDLTALPGPALPQ